MASIERSKRPTRKKIRPYGNFFMYTFFVWSTIGKSHRPVTAFLTPITSTKRRFSASISDALPQEKEESPAATRSSLPTVLLKRNQQSKSFRSGNPIVFTRAIHQAPKVPTGTLVHVAVPPKGEGPHVSLGYGIFNPNSMYRVRFLCHNTLQRSLCKAVEAKSQEVEESDLIGEIVSHHLRVAVSARKTLNLPDDKTDTYRMLHGEGDGVSGLAMDIINNVAVIMSSASWCEIHKETILKAAQEVLPTHDIVWKTTPSRLEQDGWEESSDSETEQDNPKSETQVLSSENGIKYLTFPYSSGQKTGVYCDQRENRMSVAKLCNKKTVLDLCCYHGGFSLNAVLNGGASSATGVDSSQDAIDACTANAIQNDCEDRTEFVRSDVSSFLQANFGEREFDVVVLDPPKLSPSRKDVEKAKRKYHGLNRDAIKLVSRERGGLLMTCTCSASMSQKDGGQYFLNMVHMAAMAAGRQVSLMEVRGAAPCHVQSAIAWPAGGYLTAALFHVHPV